MGPRSRPLGWLLVALLIAAFTLTAFTLIAQQPQPDGRGAQNPAIIPEGRDVPWWLERHQEKIAEAQRGGVDLLFVGDSITNNYDKPGPAPNEVFLPIWNDFFAPHHAMNLGFSGDLTQQVLWRLQQGEVEGLAPRDIVLLIGTNNTNSGGGPKDTSAGIVAVVEDLHHRMPAAQILVLAILLSGISADKSARDAQINAAVATHYKHSDYARTLDLTSLFLKDGVLDTSLFYDPELPHPLPPLHPNTAGQRRMAEAVAKALYP